MAINSHNIVNISIPGENNQKVELPFVTGVIANLSGNIPGSHKYSFQERPFINVECNTFNELVERIGPKISIEVDDLCDRKDGNKTNTKMDVNLNFSAMEDFNPAAIIDKVPKLKHLHSLLSIEVNIINSEEGMEACCEVIQDLKPIPPENRGKKIPFGCENPNQKIAYPTPFALMEAELEELIDHMARVAYYNYPDVYEKENGDIDKEKLIFNVLGSICAARQCLIEDQINLIIRHPVFKKLEASYLGLKCLFDTIKQNNTNKNIKLKVLSATWAEIATDQLKSPTVERSHLYSKVFNCLDQPGGEPFINIIFDFDISHKISPEININYIDTLTRLSKIASDSFCQFFFTALPELFGIASFNDFTINLKLDTLFSLPEFSGWVDFRKRLESRFMSIVIPRVLARLPYNEGFSVQPGITGQYRIKAVIKRYFYFVEEMTSANDYVFMNASYSLSCVLVRSFNSTNFFEYIRGISKTDDDLDGRLPNIIYGENGNSPQLFDINQAQYMPMQTTSFLVVQGIERQLDDHGFIPVSANEKHPSGVFFNVSTAYDSGISMKDMNKWSSAKLASSLNYVLCGARIAHYIRVICRDKIGGLSSAKGLEDYLQIWLTSYMKRSDVKGAINEEKKSSKNYSPLARSIVKVKEKADQIGVFEIDMQLQPILQSENISSVINLVSEIKSRS